jgi:hypothetical protein
MALSVGNDLTGGIALPMFAAALLPQNMCWIGKKAV